MALVRKNFPVQGMGCAACSARVQSTIQNLRGVADCNVSLASSLAQVDYDPKSITPSEIKKAVQDAGYDLIVTEDGEDSDSDPESEAEAEAERLQEDSYKNLRRDAIAATVIALLIMLVGMGFDDFPGKGLTLFILASVALFWCGRRFIINAVKQARHLHAGMDTLVALSTLISYLFSLFNLLFPQVWTSRGLEPHLYFESSAMIVAFILIGRTLEERAKHSSTKALRELKGLQPKSASLRSGDVFIVKPGERISADAIVLSGESYVDESMLTGEPMPNLKAAGDKVYAGTINRNGSFEARAEKVGKDTMLSSIIRMVRDAQGSKAKIQSLVDKVAGIFVPVIIGISVLTLICWLIFSPSDGLAKGLLAMVSVLVIACPCSLGLAVPTALTCGIGAGARRGILIKDADSLQLAAGVDTVVLDKTGTITEGHPEVVEAHWASKEAAGVLLAMELKSEHPLSEAIVAYLHKDDMSLKPSEISSFKAVPGKGIRAVSGGAEYFAGTPSVKPRSSASGSTIVEFARDGETLAWFSITDRIKSSSAPAIAKLERSGVHAVMLTGDNASAAQAVAAEVGISQVEAGMLPQDKAQFIQGLQAEGHKVAMAGDGINDSAALAQADLSIAMGRGSDIAIDASMVTIVSSDLSKLPQLVELSRKTVRIIKQNLFWAFFYNVLAVPIAAGVLYPICGFMLSPMVAAACMALSSVTVVANSLRLGR